MRVLLVRPPSILGYISRENIQHPINLTQLAAELLVQRIIVQIVDFELIKFEKEIFLKLLQNFKPDLIGFTAVTPHIVKCAKMAGFSKSALPGVFTVVGGAHPSVLPAQTLNEFPQFDMAIIGEGERSILSVCRALQNSSALEDIEGIAFRKDGEIYVNTPTKLLSDLDSLNLPARHLLSLKDYFNINRFKGVASPGISRPGINPTQIFTSRGCRAECFFCSNRAVFGNPGLSKQVRVHSIDRITAEVEQCIQDFGINHFS